MNTRSVPSRTRVEPVLETIEHAYNDLAAAEQLDGELQNVDKRPSLLYSWQENGATRYIQANVLEDDGYEVEVEWHVLQEYEEGGDVRRQWDHYVTDTVPAYAPWINDTIQQAYEDVTDSSSDDLEYEHVLPAINND